MKKMHFKEFINFLENTNNSYYNYKRIKKQGYLYTLCNKLNNKDKEYLLNNYNNVELFISTCEYAPELKHNVILIYDKKKKGL